MAILEIELPDGRTAELEIPDGMSMEQAAQEVDQLWQKSPEVFGAPAADVPRGTPQQPMPQQAPQQPMAQQPPADVPRETPGMLDKIEQMASQYFPPYAVGKGMFTEGQTDGALGSYGRGVASGLGSAVRGGRQAFNALTGDDAELAQLNQQEAASRQQLEQDTGGSLMGQAGKMVGQVGPAVAAGAAMAPLGIGAGAGLATRMGMGALAGGAGGATVPLTGEEEARGDRGDNAMTSAMLGGAIPAVTGGLSALLRGNSKLTPADAVSDFAKRQLGASKSKGASEAFDKVAGSIDDEYTKLSKQFTAAYDAVEKKAMAPVKMSASSRLGEEGFSLPEEVINGLNPTARRVVSGVTRASTKTSPIVDTAGKPIQDASKVDFADVREAIRDLRAASRSTLFTDAGRQQKMKLKEVIKRLEDDLQTWAKSSDEAASTLSKAKEIDASYAKQVAPFTNRNSPIGSFRAGPQDERALMREFLRGDSGKAAGDLTKRVPSTKDPMRELYGRELLTERGTTSALRQLEGGTTAEKLLSKQERDYLLEVAESLRKTKGLGGTSLSPTLENMLRQAGGEKLETMMRGVQPYGKTTKKPSIIADMLRAYSAGQLAEE